ncbi:MAG: helix-turn-helix domain-containing protein [Methylocella sp.]
MASRGERLHSALLARGNRKQMSLAAELKVDESAISRWQRNEGLSLEHAARLCEALDISLDWLVLGRGDMDLHRRELPSAHATAAGATAFLPAPVRDAIINLALAIGQELGARSGQAEE